MASENAHAALVDDANVVRQVVVIPHQGDDDAQITDYLNGLGLPGRWLDCSYLGARRGKYPALGDLYDSALDAFVSPPEPEPITAPEPDTD